MTQHIMYFIGVKCFQHIMIAIFYPSCFVSEINSQTLIFMKRYDINVLCDIYTPPPYGRTSRVWDLLLVRKSGCAGGRGFAPRPGQ